MKTNDVRRREFLKYMAMSGGLAFAGPGILAPGTAHAAGKTLRVAVSSDAWNLDVRKSSDVTALNVTKQVYNGLMNYDPDGNLFPDLAKGPPDQPDDGTYIFHLREGVQFQKGYGELTAEDVVYTFDTIRGVIDTGQSFFLKLWLGSVEAVEAVDKYTVKFSLSEPYGDLPEVTALCKVISKKAAEKFGKDFTRNPVGSGPFELVEWLKDDRIVLKRFDKHFRQGIPKLDEIVIQVIPDDTIKVTNLITGQVDMMKEIPPRNLAQLKAAPGIVVGQRSGSQAEQMYFNTSAEPFNDVNLRRAIGYAINRDAIANQVFFGMAQPSVAPMLEAQIPLKKYPDGMTRMTYDPAKAKAFLAKSSKPDGFEFTCLTTGQGWFVEQLTVIQANLADIGVKMTIEPLEKSVMFARMRKKDYSASYEDLNAAYFGYSPVNPLLFYTPPTRTLYWADEYGQRADGILKRFMTTLDVNKRQELMSEFLTILTDQVPYIQVVFVDSTDAWRDAVTNYKVSLPNDSNWWETDIS